MRFLLLQSFLEDSDSLSNHKDFHDVVHSRATHRTVRDSVRFGKFKKKDAVFARQTVLRWWHSSTCLRTENQTRTWNCWTIAFWTFWAWFSGACKTRRKWLRAWWPSGSCTKNSEERLGKTTVLRLWTITKRCYKKLFLGLPSSREKPNWDKLNKSKWRKSKKKKMMMNDLSYILIKTY